MKALSIKQPWTSLIAHGIKDIENRTWKTNFRGRIYIHASSKSVGALYELLNEKQIEKMTNHWTAAPPFPDMPTSAIIGEVDIVDCVINHPSIWAERFTKTTCCPECGCELYANRNLLGEGFRNCYSCDQEYWENINYNKPIYNWVLANPVLYDKPILNVKGKLSFWEPDFLICPDCKQTKFITWEPNHHECRNCGTNLGS